MFTRINPPETAPSGPSGRLHRREAGSALIVAMASVLVLTILAAQVLTFVANKRQGPVQAVSWRCALAGAEAGLELARGTLLIAATEPTTAWTGWTPSTAGAFPKTLTIDLTPPGTDTARAFSTSVTVTVDAPAGLNPASSGHRWYRVRASGTTDLPSVARTGVDNDQRTNSANLALRQIAFLPGGGSTRPRVTRTIEAVLKPNTPFGLAVHARDQIEIKSGDAQQVDSWDSSGADIYTPTVYSSSIARANGNIATNNTGGKNKTDHVVRLEKVKIDGSIFKGGGVVDVKSGVTLNGEIIDGFYKQLDSLPLKDTTGYTSMGSLKPGSAKKGITYTAGTAASPTRLTFSELHIHDKDDAIYIKNPNGTKSPITPAYIEMFVSDKFKLHGGAKIEVDKGVYVTLYTDSKDIAIEQKDGNGGIINGTGRAEFFQILSTLQAGETKKKKKKGRVKIKGSLTAAIRAPEHEFEIKPAKGVGHFYGSLVGRKFKISGKQQIHYDESLANIGPISGYQIVGWLEDWVGKGPNASTLQ